MNPQTPPELGPPELPSGLLLEPASSLPAIALVVAALLVLALLLAWRRARARRAAAVAAIPSHPQPPTPHERALARLELLRAQEPRTAAESDAWHVEAAALVRDFVEESFAVRAPRKTTEELLAAAALAVALAEGRRARLGELLASCDRVKFAAHAASRSERERLAASAEQFLRASDAA